MKFDLNWSELQDLNERAKASLRSQNFAEAAEQFGDAYSITPDSKYLMNRCIALMRMKQYTQCLADCETVLASQPNHVKALSIKGAALLALGRRQDAVTVLQAGA